MDSDRYKKVELSQMFSKPIELHKDIHRNLNMSLCIPSINNTYSMCIEYIKDWLLDGFDENYFKSIYIDYKHIFDDFRSMTNRELIKRNKPSLAITPRVDQEFNRDNLDLYNLGTNLYYNNARYQDSFFTDYKQNNYLSLAMDVLKMEFTIRIRVSNLGHAQDLQRFMRMRFRALGTQGREVDMDFHVPTDLILKVAKDAGFDVNKNTLSVVNNGEFMYYLNSNSLLPFLYKHRAGTNNFQYFLKMSNMYVHIRNNGVTLDEGERQGHIMNNYNVEMNIEVRFPSPKFYAYYSMSKQEYIKAPNADGSYSLYALTASKIPKVNDKGWRQYLSTDYVEKNLSEEKEIIHFDELMGDLREVIDYVKGQYLSPSVFVEFKLFNDSKEIDLDTNWNEYTITTKTPLEKKASFLVIYVDLNYFHEMNMQLHDNKNDRISYMKSKQIRK